MSYKSERRTTAWTFVCYPESMPEDWEQRMRALHVPLGLRAARPRPRGRLARQAARSRARALRVRQGA